MVNLWWFWQWMRWQSMGGWSHRQSHRINPSQNSVADLRHLFPMMDNVLWWIYIYIYTMIYYDNQVIYPWYTNFYQWYTMTMMMYCVSEWQVHMQVRIDRVYHGLRLWCSASFQAVRVVAASMSPCSRSITKSESDFRYSLCRYL